MPFSRKSFYKIFQFLVPLSIYASLVFLPFPQEHFKWGIPLIETGFPIFACVIYFLSARKENWLAKAIRLTIILASCSFYLLKLWDKASSTPSAILGLLPWADASTYYTDAIRLLEGGLF